MASLGTRWYNALGLFESRKRAASLGLPPRSTGFTSIIPGSDIDPSPIKSKSDAVTQYNGWVFAAASFVAEEMRALEWDVWRVAGTSKSEWTLDTKSILNDILARPNDTQTWGDFIELSDLHFSIVGESYWHVIRDGQRAIGLEIIYPQWVDKPIIEGGRLTSWQVTRPGSSPRVIPAADVIRLHRPHPKAPFMAAGTVEAVGTPHYLDLYSTAYATSVFRNDGGIPAGLLSSDQPLTLEQANDLREAWRQRMSKTRGEVAVLGAGSTYQPIGIPMKDMRFDLIGEFARDKILAAFHVSPALLGVTGDSNRANLEAALWGFQRHALRPRAMRVAETVRARVIPAFLSPVEARARWFEFRDVVSQDRDRILVESDSALTHGAITVNEYRERLGLAHVSDGDVFTIPSTVTVVSSLKPVPSPAVPRVAQPGLNGSASRLALMHAQAENSKLVEKLRRRREDDEFSIIRGEFSAWRKKADAQGGIYIDGEWLAERGIDAATIEPIDGESIPEFYERLKAGIARGIAVQSAARKEIA